MKWFVVAALISVLASPTAWGQETHQTYIVSSLRFEGNQALSDGDLRLQMATRQSPWYAVFPWIQDRFLDASIFAADLARLHTLYDDHGYREARIDTVLDRSKNGRVRILLRIAEGSPIRIARVVLTGLPEGVDRDAYQARVVRLQGETLARSTVAETADDLYRRLRDKGYAFASIDVETEIEGFSCDLYFRVSAGPICAIGDIHIVGNASVAAGTVRRGLRFGRGDRFRQSALRNSQRQLYRSGVFRSVVVAIPDTAAPQSPVDVAVQVSERPFRSMRIGGGYDTDEDLWASIEWTHRNFWGDARQLKVSTKISGVGREAVVGVRQPYVWDSRNWLSLSGFLQREHQSGFVQDEAGGNVAFERNISPRADLVFQASSGLIDFQADSAFTEFRLSALIDSRDDVFNPQRGMLLQATVRERGLLFQSRDEFMQMTIEGRWFQKLPFRCVLALKALGGGIFQLKDSGSVPSIERFFAGGLSSVRGWSQDELGPRNAAGEPIGGLSRLEGSVEVRTGLVSILGGAIFLDVGKVGAERGDFSLSELGWAVGGGLRIMSPVGPVRFDVGYRLTDDPFLDVGPHGDSRWRFHLSLGQAF